VSVDHGALFGGAKACGDAVKLPPELDADAMSADARSVILRSTEGAAILEVWELAGRAASSDNACGMFGPVCRPNRSAPAGLKYTGVARALCRRRCTI
jgi:hypothetical protein